MAKVLKENTYLQERYAALQKELGRIDSSIEKAKQNLADAEYFARKSRHSARRWALPFASYALTYLHGQGSHPAVLSLLLLLILWLTHRAVIQELRMLPSSKTMICMVGYICFCCIYSLPEVLGLTSEGWDLTVVSILQDVVPESLGIAVPQNIAMLLLNTATTAVTLYINRKIRAEAGSKEHHKKLLGVLQNRRQKLQNEFGLVKGGLAGELLVAGELKKLPGAYYVINDVPLSRENPALQVDHVVVGPAGVLAIETKYISGTVYPFDGGILVERSQGNTRETEVKTVSDPRKQARFNAKELSKFVGFPVKSLVVMSHPRGAWQGTDEEDCPVVHLSALLRYILVELPCTLGHKETAAAVALKVQSLAEENSKALTRRAG